MPAQPASSAAKPRAAIEGLCMAVLRAEPCMVRNIGHLARAFPLALGLLPELGGGALLRELAVGDEPEEQRHEEDREKRRRYHPAHDAGADRAARAGAGADRDR